jgi:hypothetical protein
LVFDVARSPSGRGSQSSAVRYPPTVAFVAVRLTTAARAESGASISTGIRQPASGRPSLLQRSTVLPAASTVSTQYNDGSRGVTPGAGAPLYRAIAMACAGVPLNSKWGGSRTTEVRKVPGFMQPLFHPYPPQ